MRVWIAKNETGVFAAPSVALVKERIEKFPETTWSIFRADLGKANVALICKLISRDAFDSNVDSMISVRVDANGKSRKIREKKSANGATAKPAVDPGVAGMAAAAVEPADADTALDDN